MRFASAILTLVVAHLSLAANPPEAINLRRTVVVDVVNKTKDAVVYVSTQKMINRRISAPGFDPFWQEFGGIQRVPANSLGSGFIVHPDGYVITNNHVIDRAREIQVEVGDHKYEAELISADPDADLAVLRIHGAKQFPILELGDSSDLMIGEPVIAVGNPFGYSHSVSTGIVSALHRDLKGDQGNTLLGDLVQTDAAINPGNSGGPLLNAYGQVIGINTAIRGDAQNIGFAIPINRLRDLIPELMKPSVVTKVDVPGVGFTEKRKTTPPATVTADVDLTAKGATPEPIDQINGHAIHNIIDAYAVLLGARAGEDLTIKLRNGQEKKVKTSEAPLPDAVIQAKDRFGLVVEPVTPLTAAKMGLDVDTGLLVSEVARNSPAAKAGVQPGDILIQFGSHPVTNLRDLSALIQHLPQSGRIRVGVVRENQVGFGILQF